MVLTFHIKQFVKLDNRSKNLILLYPRYLCSKTNFEDFCDNENKCGTNRNGFIHNFSSPGHILCRTASMKRIYPGLLKPTLHVNECIQKKNISTLDTITQLPVVLKTMDFIIFFQDWSGISWSTNIILLSVMMKLLISVPAGISMMRTSSKLLHLKYELKDLAIKSKKDVQREADHRPMSEVMQNKVLKIMMFRDQKQLYIRDNCHPGKIVLLGNIQIPIYFIGTAAIRNLILMNPFHDHISVNIYNQMADVHLGWIHSLVVPDPTFILPTLFIITSIVSFEISIMQGKILFNRERSRKVNIFFRGFFVVLTPITLVMPSGIVLYWYISGIFNLIQTLTLMSPNVRSVLKIPMSPEEADDPYKQLRIESLSRYEYLKEKIEKGYSSVKKQFVK